MKHKQGLVWLTPQLIIMVSLLFTSIVASAAITPAPNPPLTQAGPGPGVSPDPTQLGYRAAEYFLDGTAQSFQNVPGTPFASDGLWTVTPDATPTPAFKTRLHVYKPDRRRFNGTVYVEWVNVTGQLDFAVDWAYAHNEIVRQGAVYVAVSAQNAGLQAAIAGAPERYGPSGANLIHPGDSYSYDMFSQVGAELRDNARLVLGPGFHIKRLIAMGQSQSAGRLVTYVNALAPLHGVYDGYMIHGRGAVGAPLRQAPLPAIAPPANLLTRSDLSKPVFEFQTESDTRQARQPDSPLYRRWEVAGTAHVDAYTQIAGTDLGGLAPARHYFNLMVEPSRDAGLGRTCNLGINAGPTNVTFSAALHHLNNWVAYRKAPPPGVVLETVDGSPSSPLAVDEHGIALGGVRTPHVDAPVATLQGTGNSGESIACERFYGTTVPFSQEKLEELYKAHGVFVYRWTKSVLDALLAGYVLPRDAQLLIAAAAKSRIAQ
jgi:hypothetical protein